jgi:UDP-N-acetylmuramyl pentapeptide synthase
MSTTIAPTVAAGVDVLDAARDHRTRLTGVRFVAVTGSCGKTTSKDLSTTVLASRYRGRGSHGSNNCGTDLATDLLAVRADDHFYVQELGAWGAGTLGAGIDLIRPDIAVVTNLRNDHYSAFRGARGAQAEKGKLVACLPSSGTAVLNCDDPYVRELAGRTTARVLTTGRTETADLRAVDVTARWPAPLSFRAVHRGDEITVRTRLVGEHLLGSALAALAVGLAFDLPLDQCAAALSTAEPTPRRMSPITHPDGVTFIRDDFKAPADSIPEVLHFLRQATATRKVAVFGRISDFPGRSRHTYTHIARHALDAADTVVFVGDRAVELWGEQPTGAPDEHPGQLYVFATVAQASDFLSGHLRAGDLVLLKGSGPTDHLERVLLSRQQPVTCWAANCGRLTSCDACALLTAPDVDGSAVRPDQPGRPS